MRLQKNKMTEESNGINLKLKAFNPQVFKAYDIRGLYPQELDHNTSELIAYGFAEYLRQIDPKPTCLLGKDVRESSEELLELVREKLLSEGINVINIGLATSPMFTFALASSKGARERQGGKLYRQIY